MTAQEFPEFSIRHRRSNELINCTDRQFLLEDQTDYVVEMSGNTDFNDFEISPKIFSRVNNSVGILNFHNYVGDARFLDHQVCVQNRKISSTQFDLMLDSVTKIIAELPFAYNSPTAKPFERVAERQKQVLYHDFVYLKEFVLRRPYGESFESLFHMIANNPHRRVEREYLFQPVDQAAALTSRSLMHMFSDSTRLMKCRSGSPLWEASAARALSNEDSSVRYFPTELYADKSITTVDTAENRFVKYFLEGCRNIVARFGDLIAADQMRIDPATQKDCRQMLQEFDSLLLHPLMQSVGRLDHLPLGSSVLQKRAGYREMYEHFSRLNMAPIYPIGAHELEQIIDLKDVATLYECWAYFQVVKSMTRILGRPTDAHATDFNDMTVNLPYRARVEWRGSPSISLVYNKTYPGNRPTSGSYSVSLRPDIALEIGSEKHLFDAKFKLHRLDQFIPEAETQEQLEKEERQEKQSATFKKGDLYKMHAYRDAIDGVASVWIIYPGAQFQYFSLTGGQVKDIEELTHVSGVGAIPVIPGEAGTCLEFVMQTLLLNCE